MNHFATVVVLPYTLAPNPGCTSIFLYTIHVYFTIKQVNLCFYIGSNIILDYDGNPYTAMSRTRRFTDAREHSAAPTASVGFFRILSESGSYCDASPSSAQPVKALVQ